MVEITVAAEAPSFLPRHTGRFAWSMSSAVTCSADEHEEMFDYRSLSALAEGCRLREDRYKRFLAGANQLFILVPSP